MAKSVIRKIKIRHLVTMCLGAALLAATCYGADVGLNGDVQVTGNLAAVSFSGNGSGLSNVAHYKSTVIVSPAGTAAESGADLLAALASITDASASNPYLVKIEPGIYDVGSVVLQMKQYVDMEGSGVGTTTITGNVDGDTTGVVMGASNAELRFIKVENSGGGNSANAIYNNSSSPVITNVTAIASGAFISNRGIKNNCSFPTVTDVIAAASGAAILNWGIQNSGSSPNHDQRYCHSFRSD